MHDGFSTVTSTLPVGLRDEFPPQHRNPLAFHRDVPIPRYHALLARTDPHVEALARHVLDDALDSQIRSVDDRRAACRAGVIRTNGITRRTTLLLVRFRFQLDLPSPNGVRQMITEDARFLAFCGAPSAPEWLEAKR